jgi:zinc finger SWIM domain-containing protein 3
VHKTDANFREIKHPENTKESFEWLFRTFLQAMLGKHPETIFTDQCAAIINAIGKVFPNTIVRF